MSLFYQVLEKYPYGLKGEGWDMISLCYNPTLPMDYLTDHPDGVYCLNNNELILTEWDWKELSKNRRLSWDLIDKYPDKGWDYPYLSNHNPNWEVIERHPELPWEVLRFPWIR